MKPKEYEEHIRFTAECLVYALGALNKYPEIKLRRIAKGIEIGTTLWHIEYQVRLLTLYKDTDSELWNKIATADTPRAKRLHRWFKEFNET